MNKQLRIGIIGDFNPDRLSHNATNEALNHSAKALSVTTNIVWLPTQELETHYGNSKLLDFDAYVCGPGGPYKSLNGALKAIRFCREKGWPFIGT